MMKKQVLKVKVLLIAVVLGFSGHLSAQPNKDDNRGDRIESLRIAFISRELNLTPEEAEKFWPIYNEFRNDLKTLHDNFRPKNGEQPSAEQQLDLEQKKLDLKKKYTPRFESCLGKEKLNQLYNLEQKFRDKLREMRDQRQRQNGGQSPPSGNYRDRQPGGR